MKKGLFLGYSSDSGCPLPRKENKIIANVIQTPNTAPYAASPASAIMQLR